MDFDQHSFLNALELLPLVRLPTMSSENSLTESAMDWQLGQSEDPYDPLSIYSGGQDNSEIDEILDNSGSDYGPLSPVSMEDSTESENNESSNYSSDKEDVMDSSSSENDPVSTEVDIDAMSEADETGFVPQPEENHVNSMENPLLIKSGSIENLLAEFASLPIHTLSPFIEPPESPQLAMDTPSTSSASGESFESALKSVLPNLAPIENTPLCNELQREKPHISCIKEAHLMQVDSVLKPNEQVPIDLLKIKQELGSTPEHTPITVHYSIKKEPAIGIVHRETYNKSTVSSSSSTSSSPDIEYIQTQITNQTNNTATKKSYSKTVRFFNEDNEYVVCSLKQKRGMNYDNLASKKYPKLAVHLTRLENTVEKITDLKKDKFACKKCVLTFKSKKELVEHSKLKRRSREPSRCGCCDNVSSASSSSKMVCNTSTPHNSTNTLEAKDPETEHIKLLRKSIHYIKHDKPFKNILDRPVVYFCGSCQLNFISCKALVMHKQKYHFKELYHLVDKMFTPPVVDLEPVDVKPDIIEVKVEVKDEDKLVLHHCHVCDFKAVTRFHLEFHMKSHMTTVIKNEKVEKEMEKKPIKQKVAVLKKETEKKPIKLAAAEPMPIYGTYGVSIFNAEKKTWYKFTSPEDYKKIFRQKISSELVPRFICRPCGQMYRKHHSFNNHAMKAHKDLVGHTELLESVFIDPVLDPEEKAWFGKRAKTYSCKICPLVLKNKQAMQTHMINEHCESDSD